MNRILLVAAFVAVTAIALVFGLDSLTRSRADLAYQQGQARAMVIEAQGQARLDAAQAGAITSAALLPWVVLALAAIFGGVAVVIVVAGRDGRPALPSQPAQLVERYIFFLPQAQRRQTYRQIEGYMQAALPEAKEVRPKN